MTVYFDNNSGISIELKARLGWDEPNKYPHSVLVQHDCCHDYGVRYFPERTCRVKKSYYDELLDEVYTDLSCGHHVRGAAREFSFCPTCGAKVVKE